MRDNEPEMSLEDLLENVKVMEAQIEELKVPASRLQPAAAPCTSIPAREGKTERGQSHLVEVAAKTTPMKAD